MFVGRQTNLRKLGLRDQRRATASAFFVFGFTPRLEFLLVPAADAMSTGDITAAGGGDVQRARAPNMKLIHSGCRILLDNLAGSFQ